MIRTRSWAILAATPILAALAETALAAEGRIPIPFTSPPTTPIVISAPGRYVLTRNITPTGPGETIRIAMPAGGGSVDLDLNGFSLQGTNVGTNAIEVTGPLGAFDVTIHDGTIEGGFNSINVASTPRKLVIERVGTRDSTNGAIVAAVAARNVVIRDCVLSGTPGAGVGINLRVGQALIEGNTVHTWQIGMLLGSGTSATIVKNLVRATTADGIRLALNAPTLISENTIRTDGGANGIILGGTNGCKIFDNVINSATTSGITIDNTSSGNLVWRNVISGITGGPAILVQGDSNEIAGNTMNNNACGLEFVAGADNNIYRENMSRSNAGGPPVCGAGPCAPHFGNLGGGNSSAGNNFVPSGVAPCN